MHCIALYAWITMQCSPHTRQFSLPRDSCTLTLKEGLAFIVVLAQESVVLAVEF